MTASLDCLYSFRRCPYAMRARLAIQVSGVPCQLREVVLRDKPTAMLEISPKGTVPVLQLPSGEVVDESADIMMWALGSSASQEWLRPTDGNVEGIHRWIVRTESEFKPHLDRYKYPNRYDGVDPELERHAASEFLMEIDGILTSWPWLMGQRLSAADAAVAPFVRQFANSDREWFDAQRWVHLRSWLDDFLDSPLFLAIMSKYPQWREGDEEVRFPESGETNWRRK